MREIENVDFILKAYNTVGFMFKFRCTCTCILLQEISNKV